MEAPSSNNAYLAERESNAQFRDTSAPRLSDDDNVCSTTLELEGSTVTDEELTALVMECPALRTIQLKETQTTDVGVRCLAARCSQLTSVCLSGKRRRRMQVTSAGIKALVMCPQLQALHLAFIEMGDEGAQLLGAALAKHGKFTTLHLTSNNISDEGVALLGITLCNNSSLTSLNLEENRISARGIQLLSNALTQNSSLRILNLDVNNVDSESAKTLSKALGKNSTLKTLSLGCSKIRDEGIKALSQALIKNSSLTFLNAQLNNFGLDGTTFLSKVLAHNDSLKSLDLSFNLLEDEGASLLGTALKKNHALQFLNLGCSDIGDPGACALAQGIKDNTTLRRLHLQLNKIGVKGIQALGGALQANSFLTELDLASNKIGAAGLFVLSKSIEQHPSLRTLDLSSIAIKFVGLESLGRALSLNSSLTILNLRRNKIEESGAKQLAKAFPKNSFLTQLDLSSNNIPPRSRTLESIKAALARNKARRVRARAKPSFEVPTVKVQHPPTLLTRTTSCLSATTLPTQPSSHSIDPVESKLDHGGQMKVLRQASSLPDLTRRTATTDVTRPSRKTEQSEKNKEPTELFSGMWESALTLCQRNKPEAFSCLKFCALLDQSAIPRKWIQVWLRSTKTHTQSEHTNLENRLLKELKQLGLVHYDENSPHFLVLSPVREYIRTQSQEYQGAAYQQALRLLKSQAESTPQAHPSTISNIELTAPGTCEALAQLATTDHWYDHTIALLMHSSKVLGNEADWWELAAIAARISHVLGKQEDTLKIAARDLEFKEDNRRAERPGLSTALHYKGIVMDLLGRHEEALNCFSQALQLLERQTEPNIELAYTAHEKAETLNKLRRHQEARDLHARALKVFQREMFEKHSGSALARSLVCQGKTLMSLGDYQGALVLQRQAMKKLDAHQYTSRSFLIAESQACMGVAYHATDQYEEARQCHHQALGLRKQLFGAKPHPLVADSLVRLGITMQALGDHQQAFQHYFDAVGVRKKLSSCPDADPHIAQCSTLIGSSLEAAGTQEDALACFSKALTITRRIYGKTPHPDVAQALHRVGDSLLKLNRVHNAYNYYYEALRMHEQIHQERPHPNVTRSSARLARCLTRMAIVSGTVQEALKHHVKALNLRLEIYQQRFAKSRQRTDLTEDLQDIRVVHELFESKREVAVALEKLGRQSESTHYRHEADTLRLWVATTLVRVQSKYKHSEAVIMNFKQNIGVEDLPGKSSSGGQRS